MPLSTATPLILKDPGYLLWAPLSSTEPTHAALGSTYSADTWPVAWVNLGATEDGSEFSYETSVEAITVAEFLDPIAQVTTERNGSISFNLANWTLQNLKRVLNGGTVATVSGTGATLSSSFIPVAPGSEVRCMLGWESWDATVRIVIYQAINSGAVTMNFQKAPSFATMPCNFKFEIPTSQTNPFKVYAAGVNRLGV